MSDRIEVDHETTLRLAQDECEALRERAENAENERDSAQEAFARAYDKADALEAELSRAVEVIRDLVHRAPTAFNIYSAEQYLADRDTRA